MISYIIEKEIRDNLSSLKFIITFSVCSILILLSFYTGARNYKIAQSRYEAAKQENMRQLDGLTDWRMVRNFRIFLPPQALAVLVNGISNDIGRTVEVRGRGEITTQDSRFGDDPIFAIFRFLDLEFIFQVVLSLFAVLFAYDSINGEKERGTLRLTFSYPVSRKDYIISKTAGAILSLVPLLIPLLIGAGILPLLGIKLAGEEWLRLSLIIISGLLYVTVFLMLSVFISSVTYKSSNSFLMLLVIWIFTIMIIPRISVITAGVIINVPSVDENNSAKVKLTTQLWNEDRSKINSFQPAPSTDMKDVMNEFNKFMQDIGETREKKIDDFSERLNEQRANKQAEMERLAFSMARISPAASLSLSISALSGTSLDMEELFKQNALEYQKSYAKFMLDKTGSNSGFMMMMRINDGDEKPKTINPHEMPEFVYKKDLLSSAMVTAIPDMGILLLFNIIFFVGAFIYFRKYDLR